MTVTMAVTNVLPFLTSIYSISTLIITLGMAIGNVFTHISVKMWIHQFLFDSPHISQRVAPNYPQQIIIMVAFSLTFYATQKQKEAHHISTASASIGFHLNDCQRPIRGFEERTTSHFIYRRKPIWTPHLFLRALNKEPNQYGTQDVLYSELH